MRLVYRDDTGTTGTGVLSNIYSTLLEETGEYYRRPQVAATGGRVLDVNLSPQVFESNLTSSESVTDDNTTIDTYFESFSLENMLVL